MAVRSSFENTSRLRMHYIESGPEDGIPVVMVHGNLSTGRFFETLARPFSAKAHMWALVH